MHSITYNYDMGGRTSITKNWQGKNISIPYSKLYLVEEGEIRVVIDDIDYLIRAGQLLYIPRAKVHSCYLTHNNYVLKCWCHFDVRLDLEDLSQSYVLPYVMDVDVSYLKDKFVHIFNCATLPSPKRETYLYSYLSEIVGYLLDNFATPIRNTNELDEVLRYIQDNLHSDLSIDTLAKLAGYSNNYLIKKFAQYTSTTPIRYINTLRINKAKTLLSTTDLTISDVCTQCGYDDLAYFCKLFKRYVGYPPRDYRRLSKVST